MADGRIVIDTALDNKELEKEIAKLKKAVTDQELEFNARTNLVEEARKGQKAWATSIEDIKKQIASLEQEQIDINPIHTRLTDQTTGEEYLTFSNDAQKKRYEEINKEIIALQQKIASSTEEYDVWGEKLAKAENEVVKLGEKLDLNKAKAAEYTQLLEQQQAIQAQQQAEQEQKAAEIAMYEQAITEQMSQQGFAQDQTSDAMSQTADAIGETAEQLQDAEDNAEELNDELEQSPQVASKLEQAFDAVEKKITQTLRRVFVFTILNKLISAVKDQIVLALGKNEEFAASFAQLRGAVATLAQVLASSLGGALSYVLNLLTAVITMIARLVALIFGRTISGAAASAKWLKKTAGGYKKVGKAAKDAEKSLASFDEINQLGHKDTETPDVGGGGGGLGGLDGFDVSGITDQVSELEIYLAGAMLALGAILTFTGANIPLGLALMAVGAATLASALAMDWNTMPEGIRTALTNVMTIIGAAALAIGVFLCVSGAHIPLGVGLIIVGAAALATAVGLNEGLMESMTQKTLARIMMVAGVSMLALGLVLIAVGQIPMGIALLVVGATALVAAASINWHATEDNVGRVLNALTMMAGVALLALGAILTFSGANIPLGVGLLIAGGIALASAATINWDAVGQKVKGIWTGLQSWFRGSVAPKLTTAYWEGKLNGIKEGIANIFKGGINKAIGFVNRFISFLNGLNINIPAFEFAGKEVWGGTTLSLFNVPSIPALAQGAVIPANAPFLAMLGDQRSGTNIEAPLDTIVQAFRMALSEQGTRQQEAVMVVDNTVFARLVYDLNNQEGKRIGVDLVNA